MATTPTQKRPGTRRPAAPPRRKRSPFWSRVKAFFQIITFFSCLAIVTLIVWLVLRLEQAPRTIDLNTTPLGITYIYSSDGVKLAEFFRERRKVVSIDDMPKYLQDATVAFEDKRFYTHAGVDFRGIARALSSNISHGDLKGEGGSTITQQLARNMGIEGLDRRKSVGRKFNEWIVAHQIENSYSKSEILAMYLNQVNYGSGAYGVEAAAEVYFNKHVKQLDLAQCALLAGLPNRPTEYTPYKDMDAAKGQRKRVLEQMLDQKKITPEQFQKAVAEPIKLAGMKAPAQGTQIDHAPYFVNYVTDQLRRKYGNDRLFEGNLKIYTTLNWQMQQAAEEELVRGIREANGYGANQGALVCLDPKTGEIKAMVGGVDYKKNQINYATHGRQPGSAFKAVVYAAAINDGSVKETSEVYDGPRRGDGFWLPHDDTPYSYRSVDLRTAMAYSINVPAVRVIHLIGPQTAIRYARMMGVRSNTPLDPVLSLALGSSPVSPLEMASVYSTFPAGGNHPEPSAWTRLADAQDNVIEDVPPAIETHVLQKETVTQLDDMLRAVVTQDGGTGRMVAQYIPEARGKTGTTQEHKDVWFVGYSPTLVTAVWAGHPIVKSKTQKAAYGQPMESNAFGGTVCAPIWGRFMARAQPIFQAAVAKEAAQAAKAKAKLAPVLRPATNTDTSDSSADASVPAPRERRRRPAPPHDNGDGTVTVNVDDTSGLLAPEGSSASHPETFSTGTEPSTLSPQYTATPTDATGGSTDTGTSSSGTPPSDTPRTPRRRRHASRDTVTLMINPEDGMLATKWCPQQVSQTFTRGEGPHRYSTMYSAPPGEQ